MCNMRGDQLAQLVERENYVIQVHPDVLGYIDIGSMFAVNFREGEREREREKERDMPMAMILTYMY